MQTSKLSSNLSCNPQSKDSIVNFIWIDNTTNNDIVIDKICERNLCSKETAASYLNEYHKFQFCLGKEFRSNELLQDQMLLFPSAIVSRIWRLHQLFTQEYPSLCRDLGFNFISFNPEKVCFWSKSEKEIENLRSVYEKTLSVLKKEFKQDLNEQIWPSNYDDMVKQHLLSFHINMTTYKSIEQTINNLNGILKYSEMSAADIKNKVIPELRKTLPQFKESDFILQNPESQTKHAREMYSLFQNCSFPAEMIAHIQNEYLLTAESTRQVIKEYKKFFMMFLVQKNFSQVPSAFVDEVWHTHINFAKVYANTCNALAGGMVNHIPATNIAENEQEIMSQEFKQTMELYEKLFGKVNEQYWQLDGEYQDDHQNFFWVDLYEANKKAQSQCEQCNVVKISDNIQSEEFEEQNSFSTEANSVIQETKNDCQECYLKNKNIIDEKSCSGCNGDCNGLTEKKKSCSGCNGDCNGLAEKKKSCSGCNGDCNGLVEKKKSCSGCNGDCNGLTEKKKSCSGCNGDCNGLVEKKKSCSGCNGDCNGLTEKMKSCSGCNGDCNGLVEKKKSCSGCNGDCNGLVEKKKSCSGCNGDCNGLAEKKKSCSGCNGDCNGLTEKKKSCSGCNGDCNGLVEKKKSCSGCNGDCNGLVEKKKSCSGCNGDCNGLVEKKKSCSGCNGNCNGQTEKKKSCSGCNGDCNGLAEKKKSCSGCNGDCNGLAEKKKSCSGCNGDCNSSIKKANKKLCGDCFLLQEKSAKKLAHGVNTINLGKAKMIRFCGDCFLLSESAFERSKQNFTKIEENAKKINQCGNCNNQEELIKKSEMLGMMTNSKLTIVQ